MRARRPPLRRWSKCRADARSRDGWPRSVRSAPRSSSTRSALCSNTPQQGGVAPPLWATRPVGSVDQRSRFVSEGEGVLGVHRGPAHRHGGVGLGDVKVLLLEQEAVERRQHREAPAGGRRGGGAVEQAREVEIDLHPPGPQRVDPAPPRTSAARPAGLRVGAAGPRRPEAGQPPGHQQPLPQVGPEPGRVGARRRPDPGARPPARNAGRGPGPRVPLTATGRSPRGVVWTTGTAEAGMGHGYRR